MEIDFDVVVPRFDKILERGLCAGLGERDGQLCVEAAICAALDLPHGDEPTCVDPALRRYKIRLNDARWSSPTARATGLRRLGILQMGTDTGFDARLFVTELSRGLRSRSWSICRHLARSGSRGWSRDAGHANHLV